MKHYLYFSAAMLFAACTTTQPQADPASTVVNPDGTVTFNYRNDNAKQVEVSVQFAGQHPMEKDSLTGLWSLTLGPAEPDMYPYCFVVDGVSIMDPQNLQYFPNEGFKNSLLDIPGTDGPLVHATQLDHPQGRVDYVTYYSTTIGCYNNALVYVPASYDDSKDKKYPVFYLISGTTDTEEVYYKVGRMNTIIDNLVAEGKAEEMIIVLPYGNPMKIMNKPADFSMGDLFSKDLINDLMPYIEANYYTINDAEHRAIGGFSRGGNQALSCGLMNLDKFSYLCSYSSFTSTTLPGVYDNAKDTNSKINLFWLGIGTDDFLYKTSHDYIEFLDQKGINHMLEFTEGKFGHTWMNAKYFLAKTMPLLFKKEASEAAMAQGGMPLPALKGDEQPFTPSVMARIFPRQVVSPEFAEGTVTFRIKAENAQNVELVGEMLSEPLPMQRDSDGVWEVTVADIVPDVYCYNFVVDGTEVMDPTNMYLAPEIGFKRSVLEMPGAPYSINDAVNEEDPAKSLKYTPVSVLRKSTGEEYAMIIPGLEGEVPAIALYSGEKATFQAWQKIGKAQQILDQMIAAGKCKPCTLILYSGSPKADAPSNYLNAEDFATWAEARKALVEKLRN